MRKDKRSTRWDENNAYLAKVRQLFSNKTFSPDFFDNGQELVKFLHEEYPHLDEQYLKKSFHDVLYTFLSEPLSKHALKEQDWHQKVHGLLGNLRNHPNDRVPLPSYWGERTTTRSTIKEEFLLAEEKLTTEDETLKHINDRLIKESDDFFDKIAQWRFCLWGKLFNNLIYQERNKEHVRHFWIKKMAEKHRLPLPDYEEARQDMVATWLFEKIIYRYYVSPPFIILDGDLERQCQIREWWIEMDIQLCREKYKNELSTERNESIIPAPLPVPPENAFYLWGYAIAATFIMGLILCALLFFAPYLMGIPALFWGLVALVALTTINSALQIGFMIHAQQPTPTDFGSGLLRGTYMTLFNLVKNTLLVPASALFWVIGFLANQTMPILDYLNANSTTTFCEFVLCFFLDSPLPSLFVGVILIGFNILGLLIPVPDFLVPDPTLSLAEKKTAVHRLYTTGDSVTVNTESEARNGNRICCFR